MGTVNSDKIRFDTPFLILRTDQSFLTHPELEKKKNDNPLEEKEEKLFSVLFGYPFRVNQKLEAEIVSLV